MLPLPPSGQYDRKPTAEKWSAENWTVSVWFNFITTHHQSTDQCGSLRRSVAVKSAQQARRWLQFSEATNVTQNAGYFRAPIMPRRRHRVVLPGKWNVKINIANAIVEWTKQGASFRRNSIKTRRRMKLLCCLVIERLSIGPSSSICFAFVVPLFLRLF